MAMDVFEPGKERKKRPDSMWYLEMEAAWCKRRHMLYIIT